jgi:hypothetical protein
MEEETDLTIFVDGFDDDQPKWYPSKVDYTHGNHDPMSLMPPEESEV